MRFLRMLATHAAVTAMLRVANDVLQAKGLMLKKGTVVDTTVNAAATWDKNTKGERDPEMKAPQKGNQWYLSMKYSI